MSRLGTLHYIINKLHDLKVSFAFLGVAVLLVFTSIWAYREFITSPPYIDPDKYPIRGIDVSSHNDMMNLDAAASSGIEFIFIKASEGDTFRDQNFNINYDKARHAGLKIGAYHCFRFDVGGVAQAKNFLQSIGRRKLDLGVAIDVEESRNAQGVDSVLIARRLNAMVEYLNLCGYRVTFYSNREGYYAYINEVAPGSCLWICSFNSTPINAEWTFWQYYHKGKVKGIRGNVDLNVFCGNRKEWENYLNGAEWPYTN